MENYFNEDHDMRTCVTAYLALQRIQTWQLFHKNTENHMVYEKKILYYNSCFEKIIVRCLRISFVMNSDDEKGR